MSGTLRVLGAVIAAMSLAWISALTAQAGLVTVNFSGTITSIDDPKGFISGSKVGDSFSGKLVYDDTAKIAVPGANPAEYDYLTSTTPPFASPLGLTFTVGSHTFDPHYPGVMQIHVQNDLASSKFPDAFVAVASVGLGTGTTLAAFGVADTTGTALSSTDLPTSLDLSKFNNGEFNLVGSAGTNIFAGTINVGAASVPEPASVTLLGLGVVAIGGWILRRRGVLVS
jgi:hypothetical protein